MSREDVIQELLKNYTTGTIFEDIVPKEILVGETYILVRDVKKIDGRKTIRLKYGIAEIVYTNHIEVKDDPKTYSIDSIYNVLSVAGRNKKLRVLNKTIHHEP